MWEPIETAPKDGTSVIVGRDGRCPTIGCWVEWRKEWMLTYSGQYSADGCIEFEPELWMPIPSY